MAAPPDPDSPHADTPDPGALAPDAGPLERADVAAGLRLARWRDHRVVSMACKAGEVTDQEPLYAISGAVLAAGLLAGRPRLAQAGARMLASVVVAAAAKSGVKRLVNRKRPNAVLEEGGYEAGLGGDARKPRQSFPSGHAAGAAAAARAIGRVHRGAGWSAAALAAPLALTRLASGAHYPLDVVAGAAIGLAAEAVTERAARVALNRVVPAH